MGDGSFKFCKSLIEELLQLHQGEELSSGGKGGKPRTNPLGIMTALTRNRGNTPGASSRGGDMGGNKHEKGTTSAGSNSFFDFTNY